jgi:hypothetical protein
MCCSRVSLPKGSATFTLDKVFCSPFEQSLSHIYICSPNPARWSRCFSWPPSLSRAQTSGAFYKSISGSYLKLASAYCASVRGPVLVDNLRFSRLSFLSLVSLVPLTRRGLLPQNAFFQPSFSFKLSIRFVMSMKGI